MPHYVVQQNAYGKFTVEVLDVDGNPVLTSSTHDTKAEAMARAKYLEDHTSELKGEGPSGPNSATPSALRGYR